MRRFETRTPLLCRSFVGNGFRSYGPSLFASCFSTAIGTDDGGRHRLKWIPAPIWSIHDLNLLKNSSDGGDNCASIVSPAEAARLGRLAGIDLRAARITAEELSQDISLILNCARTLKFGQTGSISASNTVKDSIESPIKYPYPYSSPLNRRTNRLDVPFDEMLHGRPTSAQFPQHNARCVDGYFISPKKHK